MVSDIDGVTEILRPFRQTLFNLQAEQWRKATKHVPERRDMFWVTRAEQAINRSENTDQNAVNNGKNKTNNV
ncbi:Uncharacterised protein [Enterobacter cloacae]|jgi:hypothetical protein|nr:Uncharacterised protein [Enterobacter cloacae]